jgi:transcriptional regulator with XRE-family HTH domain
MLIPKQEHTMDYRDREYRAVCEVLTQARAEAGVTQRDLALRLKRPHSYVAKIEGGERRVDVVEFAQIARALKVDPAKLFNKIVK